MLGVCQGCGSEKEKKREEVFSGKREGGPPVSMPTTEVKPFSADGTAWETKWESRSLLNTFLRYEAYP